MNEDDEIEWFESLKQAIQDGEYEDAIKAIEAALKLLRKEQ